jgi:hypothetical protein
LHVPTAYIDEFCEAFKLLLDNHADQLVDVAVLSNFNSEPVSSLEKETREALERIGFKMTGERMIRGGVVDPQPREIAERALFHRHNLHQKTRMENEVMALKEVTEIRDDFALRGRCELYRVDLKSMASANRLHQGINLRGHQVWATYEHFQNLLAIRGQPFDEDLWDIVEFFSSNTDPNLFKERHALTQSEFRKLVQPLIRSGHIVQDFRGGFRTVKQRSGDDPVELRREYIRALVQDFPVITLKQLLRLAGTPFKPEEIKAVLTSFEVDGTLVKGFLIDELDQVCWGRKNLLEEAKDIPPIRDFVLPPSDPIAPYFRRHHEGTVWIWLGLPCVQECRTNSSIQGQYTQQNHRCQGLRRFRKGMEDCEGVCLGASNATPNRTSNWWKTSQMSIVIVL